MSRRLSICRLNGAAFVDVMLPDRVHDRLDVLEQVWRDLPGLIASEPLTTFAIVLRTFDDNGRIRADEWATGPGATVCVALAHHVAQCRRSARELGPRVPDVAPTSWTVDGIEVTEVNDPWEQRA